MEEISEITVRHFRIPLKKPYALSFKTVDEIESFLVEILTCNGRRGFGEIVPLDGYFTESSKEILPKVIENCRMVSHLQVSDAEELLRSRLPLSYMAGSPLLSALDMVSNDNLLRNLEIPLVETFNIGTENLGLKIEKAMKSGYKRIKIKVGSNVVEDIKRVGEMFKKVPSSLIFRFDANQAYSEKSALAFLDSIKPYKSQVEYLEQPLGIEAWDEMASLSEKTEIPLMLDESINNEEDLKSAKKCGVSYIKLKLFKHGGIKDLILLAKKAKQLGLRVVLGNGVSTDIGSLAEGWAYTSVKGLFEDTIEANGFLKCTMNLTKCPPIIENGTMLWARHKIFELTREPPIKLWKFS